MKTIGRRRLIKRGPGQKRNIQKKSVRRKKGWLGYFAKYLTL